MSPSLRIDIIYPTHAPVTTSKLRLAGRASLILSLRLGDQVFQGEASPLEGYGKDHLELARSDLRSLRAEQLQQLIETLVAAEPRQGPSTSHTSQDGTSQNKLRCTTDSPSSVVARFCAGFHSPSAMFCVEMLVLEATSSALGVPRVTLLCETPVARSMRQSAVIDPLAADWNAQFERTYLRGVRAFKVKCGRDRHAELAVLSTLVVHGGSELTIRLDPNGGWDEGQAIQFLESSPLANVDWLEDPMADTALWPALADKYPSIRLGIDESLVGQEPSSDYLQGTGASVVVLKPMALGGFSICLRWAKLARALGMGVCVSHLFDGPLALDAAIELAFAVQSAGSAPGLGEHAALSGYASLGRENPLRFLRSRFLRKDELILPRRDTSG